MAKAAKKATTGQGIGAYARQLILEGKTNAEVLQAVQKKFPDSKANAGTIGWYRNNLKKAGKRVKDSRDITAKAKKAAGATTKPAKKAARKAKTNGSAPIETAPATAEATEALV